MNNGPWKEHFCLLPRYVPTHGFVWLRTIERRAKAIKYFDPYFFTTDYETKHDYRIGINK